MKTSAVVITVGKTVVDMIVVVSVTTSVSRLESLLAALFAPGDVEMSTAVAASLAGGTVVVAGIGATVDSADALVTDVVFKLVVEEMDVLVIEVAPVEPIDHNVSTGCQIQQVLDLY